MSTQFRVDMYKNDQIIRRFSESFKLKILAELNTGKYSKRELSRLYGVASSTINDWIHKYDRKDLMNTRVIVETKDEISRLKELQKEIEQLKKLLLKKDIEQLMNDSFMEIAAKKLGYKSVQEFKKKNRHQSLNLCIAKIQEYQLPASVQEVCSSYGMNRDAFYKYRKRFVKRKSVEEKVVTLVQNERKEQPRIGSRKLHFTLKEQFKSEDMKVGRDPVSYTHLT